MCLNPSHIWVERGPGYEQIPVSCQQCWRCRSNKVNNYVGRSLCELHSSDWSVALTLTYAPKAERDEDLAHKVLLPLHFQQFIRALRDSHHKIRYLGVGEYGSLKGRAHFHAILFGRGKRLEIPHGRIAHHKAWPHGHVKADWNMDEKAMRYVCKYVLKNEPGKYWFTLSKKPAIGSAWFMEKALAAGQLGVLPRSFLYRPPGGDQGRPYMLRGAVKRDYIRAAFDSYLEHHTLDLATCSEWIRDAIVKVWRDDRVKEARGYVEPLKNMAEDFNRGRISESGLKALLKSMVIEYTHNVTDNLEEDARHVAEEVKEIQAARRACRTDEAKRRIAAKHYPQLLADTPSIGGSSADQVVNQGLLLLAQS